MTWSRDDDPQRAFLVERYRSPGAALDLAASTARVARLCADSGTRVRYLYSVYLPTEDTCFCLFRAPSSDDVRAVNELGRCNLDRIIDAVLMRAADTDNLDSQERT
jgi:hypothetical protein